MEEHINYLPLLLVIFLAFAVPLILGRMRWLPTIVGEIIAGVIIGVSGFNIVGESPILDIFSNMGLAFLMFLAGMEINLNQIFPVKGESQSETDRRLLLITLVVYALTLGQAFPGGLLANRLGLNADPLLMAFIFSATSLGIVLPVLKRHDLLQTLFGRAIFYSSLLADFLTVLLLTFYLITLQNGLNIEILSVSVLFLAFIVVYQLSTRLLSLAFVRTLIEELSHVTVQIKVRGAITILMIFVVLSSLLGVEIILGAFLAGMMISLLKQPEDSALVEKLEAFGFGFFIPVFFILVGATLNLRALVSSPASLLLLPALVVIALLVKSLPMLLYRSLLSWREVFSASALVNTHLSIEIAVAVIGLRLGLLDEAANVTVILFAALTVLIMPVIFNLLAPVRADEEEERYIIIFGAEDLGVQVARMLRNHGEIVRFLEPEAASASRAEHQGFEIICGKTIPGCLEEAVAIGQVQSLLVLSSNDTRNLLVCYAAKRLGIDHIVALLNDPGKLSEYRSLGVRTYNSAMYQATTIAMLARNQDLMDLLMTVTDEQDVREVYVRNPLYTGTALKNLGLPNGMTIVAIARDGEMIVPHGQTRLEMSDRLTLFGNVHDIQQAAERLESANPTA